MNCLASASNLQDHFNTFCTYKISRNLSLNSLQYSFVDRHDRRRAAMCCSVTVPMTGNGLYVGALVRTDPRFERPDLQMNISAWSTIERTRTGIISHPHPGISISPVHLPPEARGTVRLEVQRSARAAANSFRLHEIATTTCR